MNVLLVNQFYPPDPAPTGRYLRDLAESLAGRGHSVTVVCSRQTYADPAGGGCGGLADGVRVIRLGSGGRAAAGLAGKALGYAKFMVGAWRAIRQSRPAPEMVVTMTTPPWIGSVAGHAAGRESRRVQWIMDLYPHVLAAHGIVREGSVAYRVLSALTRREWRRASLILTPGAGMAERVMGAAPLATSSTLRMVPLWALDTWMPWPEGRENALRRERGWGDGETVLMYAGNMGLGHDIGAFLQAAGRAGKGEPWRLVFAGWGRRAAEVSRYVKDHPGVPVELLKPVGFERLAEHLASADVLLASLKGAWSDLIVPCKLQAAFAAKRPVLFVGPVDSDPARWVKESGGGWVVAENDPDGLLAAIRECGDKQECRRRGQAAHRYSRERFDRDINLGHVVKWIEELAAGNADLFESKGSGVQGSGRITC